MNGLTVQLKNRVGNLKDQTMVAVATPTEVTRREGLQASVVVVVVVVVSTEGLGKSTSR